MNLFQIILTIVIALAGYPLGLLLAHYTREELKKGRKWFKLVLMACVLGVIVSLIFSRGENLLFLIEVFVFMFLLALASLIKSRKAGKI